MGITLALEQLAKTSADKSPVPNLDIIIVSLKEVRGDHLWPHGLERYGYIAHPNPCGHVSLLHKRTLE